MNKKIVLICLACQKPFEIPECIAQNRKYCSRKCAYTRTRIAWNKGLRSPRKIPVRYHVCAGCGKQFIKNDYAKHKYCSRRCYAIYNVAKRVVSIESKVVGVNNKGWKGDSVSYRALHEWVDRWKGKPNKCELCGFSSQNGRYFHWANIDHKYRRSLNDFIRLCSPCHIKYDLDNNLRSNYKRN